jgi:hypothetical protein
MTDGWVVEGTWVVTNRPGLNSWGQAVGYVFGITPCARVAVLIPYDGWDEVAVLDPGEVIRAVPLAEVKQGLDILTPAEIDSITFDKAEAQLRVDAARARENSHV